MRLPACCLLFSLCFLGTGVRFLSAEDAKTVYSANASAKFVNFPGLPNCMTAAVENGDPSKGPSVILAKAGSGCRVPWHWHTPTEQLMIVSGSAKGEMKDGSPVQLHAGDYLSLPGKGVHQFTCLRACSFFLSSDATFDLHYVDGSGKEISPEEALKGQERTRTSSRQSPKEPK
ncbi:MAG: cupin domain-containing protein [Acidobacteria bacterium]|nr:cupin domain-containing protein [Acidobacteriota bacterium]